MQKPEIETLSALTLQRASLEQKPALRQLLELYQYDFSEFTPADVDENGSYGYPYLDHYWVEPNRHPILFKMDGKWLASPWYVPCRRYRKQSFRCIQWPSFSC